jgi:hypothetical protein
MVGTATKMWVRSEGATLNRGDIIGQGIVEPVPERFWQEKQPPFDTSDSGYQHKLRQGAQANPVTVWGLL